MGSKVSTVCILMFPYSHVSMHTATRYWHGVVASVAQDFADSGILFAIANEADYPDDLR